MTQNRNCIQAFMSFGVGLVYLIQDVKEINPIPFFRNGI